MYTPVGSTAGREHRDLQGASAMNPNTTTTATVQLASSFSGHVPKHASWLLKRGYPIIRTA